MKIESALKVIWLSVGVLLLIVLASSLFLFFNFGNTFDGEHEEAGVTVDNSTKQQLEKVSLELSYSTPVKLGNCDNYLLKVYISYKEDETTLKAGLGSYSKDMDVDEPSNIIILNNDFTPIRTLLNKKALIKNLEHPVDGADPNLSEIHKEMKFILYEIVVADTDKDGQLDGEDAADLYISDLDGSNLTPITKDWRIDSFEFLDGYSRIIIQYYKEGEPEKLLFATYSLEKKELTELKELGKSLDEVKEVLIK